MNYDELNQKLQTIAREAGTLLLESTSDADRESTDKTNAKDYVTVTDIKAQNIISKRLKEAYPTIVTVGEESPEADRELLDKLDFTGFVIDPIDGTSNFKRDMRESAVSIGYIENGESQVGIAYDPYKDELFTAVKGQGAFRNGEPIHVSDQAGIEGATIICTNSYDDAAMNRNLKRQLAIYEQTGKMPWFNCPGSGVLGMCYVACGRFDAYHHNGTKPWDNAAAFLIAREAGANITTLKGEEARFNTRNFVMATPKVFEELKKVFAAIDPELLS